MKSSFLSHRNSLYYGVLGFPLAFLGIPLYLYLPNYYHENYGLSLALIGSALLAARLSDVFTDPLIGWYSDRFKSRKTKLFNRQWQIASGAVLLLIGSYQLFFPPIDFGWGYLFIWSLLTYLGWTLMQVPHQAMNAEISLSSLHKTQLASYREAFAIIGVITVIALPAALAITQDSTEFYLMVFTLLAVITLVGVIALFRVKVDRMLQIQDESNLSENAQLSTTLRTLWYKNRAVFTIMPSYFVNNLANAIPATLFMIFVSDYLQLETYIGLFLLTYFAAGIIALPLWLQLSKYFSKQTVWQASMLLAGISFVGVFTLQAGDWLGFLVICILTGLSLGVDIAMPTSIQADLTQNALNNQVPAAGLLFGIWGMLTKLSLALAIGISFPILDWAQNQNFVPQIILLLLYAAVPIILKIVAWWLLVKFDETMAKSNRR